MPKKFFLLLLAIFAAAGSASSQPAPSVDLTAVTKAIGRPGALQSDGVMKYSFPRGDMTVDLGGVRIRPALALGSWVAFKSMGSAHAMVMGDLVLSETEVQPVITALEQKAVRQSAVHNHLLGESPRVVYVHIAADGDPVAIATTIRSALALTHTPPPAASATAPAIDLDTALVHRNLGYAGKVTGGVYQVSVPRPETITMNGETIPPSMGVSTAINFQPTGAGRAAITGDFVLQGEEVGRIIPILRANDIAVTALHSHMTGENPRLYFMHFWANDDAAKLAAALGQALGQIK